MSPWNLLALSVVGLLIWLVLIFVAITGFQALDDLGTRRPDAPVCNIVEVDCEP